MNHSIRKTALAAAVALPAALGVQTASAALITDWDYQIDSAFTAFSPSGSVTGSENNTDAFSGEPTKLSWGTPSNPENEQSSISVDSDVDSSGFGGTGDLLETNDTLGVPGATFNHDNNVILASSVDLDTFTLSTNLFLRAAVPSTGDELNLGPLGFSGSFSETFNAAELDDCVEGSTTACDDIFVLGNAADLGTATGPDSFTIAAGGFIIEDYQYSVFIDLDGVSTLTPDQCAAADAATGCVGFLTEEDTNNFFNTMVRINATEIPAPGVLALLGVGLLGLGFTHRARRS